MVIIVKRVLLIGFIILFLIVPKNVLAIVTREEFNNAMANVSISAATTYADDFVYSYRWGGSPSNPEDKMSILNSWLESAKRGIKIKNGYIYGSTKANAGIRGSFTNKFPVFCGSFVHLMIYHASGGKVTLDDFDRVNPKDLQRGDIIDFPSHIAIFLDNANDNSEYTWTVAEASSKIHVAVTQQPLTDTGYRIKDSALAKLDYNIINASYDFHDRLDDFPPIIVDVQEIANTNKVKIMATDYKHYDLSDASSVLEPENFGIVAYQITKIPQAPTTDWKKIDKKDNVSIEAEVDGNGKHYVFVKDVGGNVTSREVNFTKIVIDEEKPTLGEFSYEGRESSLIVSVVGAKDNNGIDKYRFYLDDKLVGETKNNTYEIKNLLKNQKYNLYYEVVDVSGNVNKSMLYEVYTEIDAISVEVSKERLYLTVSEVYQLSPKVVINSENYHVRYKSSNPSVARVDNLGNIVGVSSGNSVVTVSVGKTKVDVNVKVSTQKIAFSLFELPVAYIGQEYNFQIETTPQSEISIVDSKLPDGLHLENNHIKGIPQDNTSGNYELKLHAKYQDSESEREFVLTVKYDLEINDLSTKRFSLNEDYNEVIKANYPGTITFKSGNLPKGMMIKGNSLVGTPTEEGEFSFTLVADYMNSKAEREFTIKVSSNNLIYYLLIIACLIGLVIIIYLVIKWSKPKKHILSKKSLIRNN